MLSNLLGEVGIDFYPVAGMFGKVLVGLYFIFIIYWYGIRREKYEKILEDERTKAVVDRSARNAFVITWLTMFQFVNFDMPDAGSLSIVVASGLVVFVVSYYVYFFKGSK